MTRPLGLALACTVALAPRRALADSFWDVSTEEATRLMAALQPGDILVHMSPGLGGEAQMVALRSLETAKGDYSDGVQLRMKWRGIGVGTVGDKVAVPPVDCFERHNLCLQAKTTNCAGPSAFLDVPYTFVRRDDTWVWVGALAGLQAPGPSWTTPMPVTASHEQAIRRCPRLRSQGAYDWA